MTEGHLLAVMIGLLVGVLFAPILGSAIEWWWSQLERALDFPRRWRNRRREQQRLRALRRQHDAFTALLRSGGRQ